LKQSADAVLEDPLESAQTVTYSPDFGHPQ
jgi:hypothetical protein